MKSVLAHYAFTPADWTELGGVCMGAEKPDLAASCYGVAVSLDPDHAEGWLSLATCLDRLGFPVHAERALHKALKLDHGFQRARLALVALLLRQGRQTNAFQVWWEGRKSVKSA